MSKISNVILMLQYLESGKKYSVKELSERLECSERMVRLYKDELDKAGIYIDAIMGPYGGYTLNQSIRIPSRKFTIDDYNFLHNLSVDAKDKERLEIIADKVHGVYFNSKDENIELDAQMKIYYNTLCRALKERKKVLIDYYCYTEGSKNRIIHPLDMFLYNSGWVCAAFCELDKDMRHFELKRINAIKLLDEEF